MYKLLNYLYILNAIFSLCCDSQKQWASREAVLFLIVTLSLYAK